MGETVLHYDAEYFRNPHQERPVMLNTAILGAGAMGCLYASYLCKNPEINLLLLDHRPEKVDEINKNGLLMVENDEEIRFNVPAKVSGHGKQDPVDILLVFVKAHQTYAALKANRSLIGPKTIVVSLQNGMGESKNRHA